jgi:actin-related protein
MHLEASEHPVLLSESIRGKKKHREKMAEIMFERFRVPSLSIMPQPLMSLRASDRASGVVVDIGDSGSHIVPIHEYQIQHNAIAYMKIGGQDLTKYLRDLLQARGYSFSTQSDFEIVRDIKENLCYLSTSYDRDIHELKTTTNIDKSFELSDGQIISQIDIERIKCAEPLFRPSLLGLEMPGIHGQIANSVRKCPLSMYSALYKCVQLSGASTKFANFRTRLHEGISRSVSRKSQIVVKEPPNRDVLCWIGGSKLASSASEFEPFLTQNSDYQERGPASIHRQ